MIPMVKNENIYIYIYIETPERFFLIVFIHANMTLMNVYIRYYLLGILNAVFRTFFLFLGRTLR